MAHVTTYAHPLARDLAGQTAARPGFFRRLFRAMQEARMRQVEREIAIYLDRTGGRLTDDAERVIERRFLSAPSSHL